MDVAPAAKSRSDLREEGWNRRTIAEAVRSGTLIRARQNCYIASDAPTPVVESLRVGGRLTCLSLLQLYGIFVFSCDGLHVSMRRNASRMRSPASRESRLPAREDRSTRLHWSPPVETDGGTASCVGLVDALVHAMQCQPIRHSVATLDSAMNKGLLTGAELEQVLAALPGRFDVVGRVVDGRAQAGTETLVRLMARSLGCTIEPQAGIPKVGIVDLLLDDWLVVECDSKEFHSDWDDIREDRRRDRELAAHGYCVLRVLAEDILYHPDVVLDALHGLVLSHRRGR